MLNTRRAEQAPVKNYDTPFGLGVPVHLLQSHLTIVAGVDLHLWLESELPVCQIWNVNYAADQTTNHNTSCAGV